MYLRQVAAVQRELGVVDPAVRMLSGDEGDGFGPAIGQHETLPVDAQGLGQDPVGNLLVGIGVDGIDMAADDPDRVGGHRVGRGREVEEVGRVHPERAGDRRCVVAVRTGWGNGPRRHPRVGYRATPMHPSEPTGNLLRPDTVTLSGTNLPALVWRLDTDVRACASTVLGGGIGSRGWVLNAQVPSGYHHPDPGAHLRELADEAGLTGPGVGFLTAADVTRARHTVDGGVEVWGTIGLDTPIWAAAPEDPTEPARAVAAGTINLVVAVPAPLSDAALVNAVTTVTEAKVQALHEARLSGTGTPTDAVCVLSPDHTRDPARYGGPRSEWGARVARAVHRVISDDTTAG